MRRRLCVWLPFIAAALSVALPAAADFPDTIGRIKPSIVAVGTYKATNSPPFTFRGTGFAVGDGNLVATNAHVLPVDNVTKDGPLELVVMSQLNGQARIRPVSVAAVSPEHDLALLRLEEGTVPPMTLNGAEKVREGQSVAYTGFPIGGALGFSPVTHRGMISAITPIALPSPTAQQLNAKSIRRLKAGPFNIYQLDGTAYPGNSGSPVFDFDTGNVIGIINMVYVKGTRESAISQPTGITYAIPSTFLRELLDSVR